MRGVLVGADARQEWLLPWWWDNFRRHCSYPVAFVDFGLSEEMKGWCQKRGEWIRLQAPVLFVRDRDEVGELLAEEWERFYPDGFWSSREAWFKKPLACLSSPFESTVWIDVDCEIVGPLEGVWAHGSSGMALAKDPIAAAGYNSGVIVFQKRHPLILEWAEEAVHKNGLFRGDQDLLSHILRGREEQFSRLPAIYNWCIGQGKNGEAVIVHWSGDAAKSVLRNQLILNRMP